MKPLRSLAILSSVLAFAAFTNIASADDDCRPYYIQNGKDGPGSVLMAFFLPMMAVAATGASAGEYHAPGTIDRAWCAPAAIARHARDRVISMDPRE